MKAFFIRYDMVLIISGYEVIIDDEDYERISNYNWGIKRIGPAPYVRCGGGNKATGCRKTFKPSILMHRFIMGLEPGDKRIIDHKNMNTLDNRKENLRICTATENSRNVTKRKNNKTGLKGVAIFKQNGRYRAYITVNKKQIHLGYYTDKEKAHNAYIEASKKYHGEYGRFE